jgi:pyridinium-3,5-biscarboxylic acid mononucleotide synthase
MTEPAAPDLTPFARVDTGRHGRIGLAEAVYAPGKTPEQCAAIVGRLLSDPAGGPVLLTRADDAQAAAALEAHPDGARTAATLVWRAAPARPGSVAVVTAGTADLPVATECATTLWAYGVAPAFVADVGVAGLHRVLAVAPDLAQSDCVVVVAGMEGALASVLGGLVPCPVVAVPTSTGYGSSLEGVTALLAMLASCAQGITVVGIDNGFGAACAALRLLNRLPGGTP